MEKLFLLFLMLCFSIPAMAQETNYVINSVDDGKKIVCTGKKIKVCRLGFNPTETIEI